MAKLVFLRSSIFQLSSNKEHRREKSRNLNTDFKEGQTAITGTQFLHVVFSKKTILVSEEALAYEKLHNKVYTEEK